MNKIPSTTGTEKEDAISPATVGFCYQKPWAHSSLFYSPPFQIPGQEKERRLGDTTILWSWENYSGYLWVTHFFFKNGSEVVQAQPPFRQGSERIASGTSRSFHQKRCFSVCHIINSRHLATRLICPKRLSCIRQVLVISLFTEKETKAQKD